MQLIRYVSEQVAIATTMKLLERTGSGSGIITLNSPGGSTLQQAWGEFLVNHVFHHVKRRGCNKNCVLYLCAVMW